MREIAQAEAMSFEQQLIFTLKTMYAQQFAKHFADMPMNIVFLNGVCRHEPR